MESISLKLQALNCPQELYPQVYKHFVALNLVSLSDLNEILSYLSSKGLVNNEGILVKPADFVIFANSLEEIKASVESMEQIGEIDALKESLRRLNSKSAVKNIEYLKSIDEPYKTPEGKYSSIPFSLKKFNSKYDFIKEVTEKIPVEEIKAAEKAPEIDNTKEYDKMINTTSTAKLSDEEYARFDKLVLMASNTLSRLYGYNDVSNVVKNNILKLVASNAEDDALVLFAAMTHNRKLDDESINRIKSAIIEEVRTASEEVEMGRAA